MKDKKDIIVVGYVKSGNTWLSRLIGDILDSPVTGWKSAKPIAEEGLDRKGDYVVRQLHLKPIMSDCDEMLPSATELCIPKYNSDVRLVHIIRDPRDVAVSVKYYWDLPDIKTALDCMKHGEPPLKGIGAWDVFVDTWRKIANVLVPMPTIYYESLHDHTYMQMYWLLNTLNIPRPTEAFVHAAIIRQSFDVKKAFLTKSGDRLNYGKKVQVKNLRKGQVGDWENHFTEEDRKLADEYFGKMMLKLGYIKHKDWWAE